MAEPLALFATAPRGLERVLADELRELGAARVHEVRAGVAFNGDLELAYRAFVAPWIAVQPNVQYVIDPALGPRTRDSLIVGGRLLLTL